jgi:hypothetical protein
MALRRFSDNPAATTPLTGTEVVPGLQGGSDVQMTAQDIADLASPGLTTRHVNIALSDMSTSLTTGTGVAVWFAPEDGEFVSAFIGVNGVSSSGAVTVDMNDSGGSVFTTSPSIDSGESTSITGTNAVFDGTVTFVRGDKFTFDIDAAGTSAEGLQISLEYSPA